MWSANSSNRKLFRICLSQRCTSHPVFLCIPSSCILYEAAEGVWRRLLQRKGCLHVKHYFWLHVKLYVLIAQVFPFKVSHWACVNRLKCYVLFWFFCSFLVYYCCLNKLAWRAATMQLNHDWGFVIQTELECKIPRVLCLLCGLASVYLLQILLLQLEQTCHICTVTSNILFMVFKPQHGYTCFWCIWISHHNTVYSVGERLCTTS